MSTTGRIEGPGTAPTEPENSDQGPRRSERDKRLTEKAQANLEHSIQVKENKFKNAYSKWKSEAKSARELLKTYMSSEDLEGQIDKINAHLQVIMQHYDELRKLQAPTPEVLRQVDCATQISKDIETLINQQLSDIGDPENFNPETALFNVRTTLDKRGNPSVFGESITESQSSQRSHRSKVSRASKASYASSGKADAEAELAAKKVQLQSIQEIQTQRDKLAQIEAEYHRKMKEEADKLERMQAEKELKVAAARVKVYENEEQEQTCGDEDCSMFQMDQGRTSPGHSLEELPNTRPLAPPEASSTAPTPMNLSTMLQAFQESVFLGRLPVPEPSVFSGNPMQFPEWKNAFTALIGRKPIGAADKLFYLRKYTTGSAAKMIQGAFLRSDEAAYQDAWTKLNARYGDPFIIQRAFRERIAQWPKVGDKDAKALRDLSDFLNSCNEAIPHVKGLAILNDCEENRKMMDKLPEWAIRRWNRRVTSSLKNQEYPSFQEFCEFVSEEAEVACNPMTSPLMLKPQGKDRKENKQLISRTLAMQGSDVVPSASTPRSQTSANPDDKQDSFCTFCNGPHSIHKCFTFEAKSMEEKKLFIQENKLCFGCLRKGHLSKNCKRRATCAKCKRSHPTPLHDQRPPSDKGPAKEKERDRQPTLATSCCAMKGSNATSMIVPVWVAAASNPAHEVLTYAMLDTQSDSSFILNTTARALGVAGHPVRLKLSTMTASSSVSDCYLHQDLTVRGMHSDKVIPINKLYTREFIPAERSLIPTSQTALEWSHLESVAGELPAIQDCEVGLLIGFNCPQALTPRETVTGQDNEPYAVKTDLGWSIVGGPTQYNCESMCHRVGTMFREGPITSKEVLSVLERDFSEDKGGKVSQEDLQFLRILESSVKQLEDGHLQMPLPFRSRPNMPSNKTQASIRLSHLKRKLMKDTKYREDYVNFVQNIIDRGDAEEAPASKKEGEVWYIPHHGVYHHRKPNKIRVVFDCSSQHHGTALNDHLLSGPDLTNNLIGVLCRFRYHPVAIACDIERMFHQFLVEPQDRDYLRFLWWKNGDFAQHPTEYRMKVHLFGATSSPGCANYGLKFLCKQYEKEFPLAAPFVRHHFYVDDGLFSIETDKEAINLTQEARDLCSKGGLRLHKFVSNSREVLLSIPPEERAESIKEVNLNKDDLPYSCTLGIQWDVEKDEFFFKIENKDTALTRRGILSMVASVYDPLGFLAPFVLTGKMLLQHMCRSGIGWDDPLPEELKPQWEKWTADFPNVTSIRIPRCLKPGLIGEIESLELHHFSDASNTGYGQCSYLRIHNRSNRPHCVLLMAKSRVAPTKITTIPRLELTAAVVSVKISIMLKEELNLQNVKEIFWTDSQVVLGYINNEARRFHTFVANRVQTIRENTSPDQWFYVETSSNPADHASRGLTASALHQSSWYTGPEFLWDPEFECPSKIIPQLSLEDPEVRKLAVLSTTVSETSYPSIWSRLTKFSSWLALVRAIARLQRRAKGSKDVSMTSVLERQEAVSFLVKMTQEQEFKEKLPIKELDPFTDDYGILRVGGRLRNSSLPFSVKHPMILPRDSHISKLIVDHYHQKVHHQGRGITLNEVRANGFWIISGGKLTSELIHKCVTCRRNRRPAQEQKMADLPEDRVEPSPPFLFSGMDCFGPFITRQGRKEFKRYGLLLTCLCSRAIHIELLDDLSTDAFINGLRCFIAIRGKVRQLRSDQGSNFIGAKNELSAALKELDTERVASYLVEQDCDFIMNAPQSSHVGGVWERQIRTVRSILSGVVGLCPGRLDDSSLRTLFYEAMAIVNSRPLSVDTINDPTSLEPLTPNHLLTMKSSVPLPPPGNFATPDLYLRKRWRRVQYLTEQFWSRWRKEYLQNLSRRQRWTKPRRNVMVGDIVLILEPDVPRYGWPTGIIVEATMDKDGLVRKAKVRLGTKKLNRQGKPEGKPTILERPVQKLVLLLEGAQPHP